MKTNKVARTLDTDYDDDDGNGVGYDTRVSYVTLHIVSVVSVVRVVSVVFSVCVYILNNEFLI